MDRDKQTVDASGGTEQQIAIDQTIENPTLPPTLPPPQQALDSMFRINDYLFNFYQSHGGDLTAVSSLAPPTAGTSSQAAAQPSLGEQTPYTPTAASIALQNLKRVLLPQLDAEYQPPAAPTTHTQPAPADNTPMRPPAVIQPQKSEAAVIMDQLKALLEAQSANTSSSFSQEYRPPYPQRINSLPYPFGYTTPKFRMFDGTAASPSEHVHRFIESLGAHCNNCDLRMREFSKSLTGKAYSWYANLAAESISTWEQMQETFCRKFFLAEDTISFMDLSSITQYPEEDVMSYIRRFRDKCLEIREDIDESKLVQICAKGLLCEYRVHLINNTQGTFSKLSEMARNLAPSIAPLIATKSKSTLGWVTPTAPSPAKQPTVHYTDNRARQRNNTNNDNNINRNNNFNQPKRRRFDPKDRDEPPPLPCAVDEAVDAYTKLVAEGKTRPFESTYNPTQEDRAHPNFCLVHKRTGHPTKECYVLRRAVDTHIKRGDLALEEPRNVNRQPFPNHEQAHHAR